MANNLQITCQRTLNPDNYAIYDPDNGHSLQEIAENIARISHIIIPHSAVPTISEEDRATIRSWNKISILIAANPRIPSPEEENRDPGQDAIEKRALQALEAIKGDMYTYSSLTNKLGEHPELSYCIHLCHTDPRDPHGEIHFSYWPWGRDL